MLTIDVRQATVAGSPGPWHWEATGAHGWYLEAEAGYIDPDTAMRAGILAKRDEFGCVLTAEESETLYGPYPVWRPFGPITPSAPEGPLWP